MNPITAGDPAPAESVALAREALCKRVGTSEASLRALGAELIAQLPDAPDARGYRDLPPAFHERIAAAAAALGRSGAAEALNLVLTELAAEFQPRFERAQLPSALLPYYRENVSRILARTVAGDDWASSSHNDIFLKDLGILRMTLIPCASHLVFRNSGVPRSLVLRQRPRDLARAVSFFCLRSRGFRPFLENHVHPAMLDHFNPAGRERCYELVAMLLKRWPDSRGLMGLSWYYDPKVAPISPNLAYLHDVPAAGGALFLPAGGGTDVVGDATAKSRTRRAMFERGEYTPSRYLMAWARSDILDRHGNRE